MDGALQTVIGLVGNHPEGTLYAPFMLGEVELRKPLTALCYVYVRWANNSSATDTSTKNFHLSILDETGKVLVHLTDFSVRAFTPHPPIPCTTKK